MLCAADIAAAGDDGNYGSAATLDVLCLQALSKRIHYGKFVAEAKFRWALMLGKEEWVGVMGAGVIASLAVRMLSCQAPAFPPVCKLVVGRYCRCDCASGLLAYGLRRMSLSTNQHSDCFKQIVLLLPVGTYPPKPVRSW